MIYQGSLTVLSRPATLKTVDAFDALLHFYAA